MLTARSDLRKCFSPRTLPSIWTAIHDKSSFLEVFSMLSKSMLFEIDSTIIYTAVTHKMYFKLLIDMQLPEGNSFRQFDEPVVAKVPSA